MAICTICCEGIDPGERGPGGELLCPECARLLRWFWGHFADVLLIPDEGFFSADTMFQELGADSLDTVEWILEAEEQFGVTITDLDAERMWTVADYLRHIRLHAKKGRVEKATGRDPLWDRELDG
jgi:acyl carrier protein